MMIMILSILNAVLLLALLLTVFQQKKTLSTLQLGDGLETALEPIAKTLRDEVAQSRKESRDDFGAFRTELNQNLTQQNRNLREEIQGSFKLLNDSLVQSQDRVRETIEKRLELLQRDNAEKIEQMRKTVDEKLETTLQKRLGESFRLVSERLEQVHKGLGEMQNLAIGVGDLKKVLTNVKTRGTWGEIQLGSLLEQMLTPDQYIKNYSPKKAGEVVEFAIRLPGPSEDVTEFVHLPIDSKYPMDDYQRLIAAQERGDAEAATTASDQLESAIKKCARDIREKYISPPSTTDFALLFLPTESLYAEVLRRPGLAETLNRDFRVSLAGPSTLAALLNSLQMGFRTLAIQKRSGEVWKVLGAVKTNFQQFGQILDHVQKKLQEAGSVIEKASAKSRNIETKLRKVEALPTAESDTLLSVGELGIEVGSDWNEETL